MSDYKLLALAVSEASKKETDTKTEILVSILHEAFESLVCGSLSLSELYNLHEKVFKQ